MSSVGETHYFLFCLTNLIMVKCIEDENMKQLQVIYPDVHYSECSWLKAVLEKR